MELTDSPAGQHSGGIFNYFQGATIHNLVINGNMSRSGTEHYHAANITENTKQDYTDEQIARAIENCQDYFWGNSAYAVVYCLCRDDYNQELSQSGFERMVESLPFQKKLSFMCKAGTITNAFSDNPVYKTHVSRWETQGASPRALLLLKMLRKELEL